MICIKSNKSLHQAMSWNDFSSFYEKEYNSDKKYAFNHIKMHHIMPKKTWDYLHSQNISDKRSPEAMPWNDFSSVYEKISFWPNLCFWLGKALSHYAKKNLSLSQFTKYARCT